MEKRKIAKLNEMGVDYSTLESKIEAFSNVIASDALNTLWAAATSNSYLPLDLEKYELANLPEEAYPIIFKEMRKSWESKGTFIESFNLPSPQNWENLQVNYTQLKRKAQALFQPKDEEIIAIYIYRKIWYLLNQPLPNIERCLYLLNQEKETLYFGGLKTLLNSKDDSNFCKPLHTEIANLLEVTLQIHQSPSTKINFEIEEKVSADIPSTPSVLKKANAKISNPIPNNNITQTSTTDCLIAAYFSIRAALQSLGINPDSL